MSRNDKEEKLAKDPLITILSKIIMFIVRLLAIVMVFIIAWSFIDVIVHVYQQFFLETKLYDIETIMYILGNCLAVLIAIEIFLNIIFYLKEDAIHVPLVLATALTAVARKVIVLDYSASSPHFIYATGAVVLAVGLVYWLIVEKRHENR